MDRSIRRRLIGLTAAALIVAACSPPPPPPLGALELSPAGPVSVAVGDTLDFTASPIPNGVEWSVDGIAGGSAATGTITPTGSYEPPDRLPSDPNVTVTATDPVVAGRTASADVTVTAHGTMYVLDEAVYVYGDVHEVDGDAAPDRTFTLDAVVGDEYYDMVVVPALDLAFITSLSASPMIFRVPSISTASGAVTDYVTFDDNGYDGPSGVAYDTERDILYARLAGGLLVFDDASTAPDGALPDRVLTGANPGSYVLDDDVRITLDTANDRIFLSNPFGSVAVYDDASTIDGNLAPDRIFSITVPGLTYLWGAAYDAGRDELYLGDQRTGAAVYVMSDASTLTGLNAPSRVIGGPMNPIASPSQISYDAANDRLAVVLYFGNGFAVFDDVSTVDGDVPADRTVGGPALPIVGPFGGYLDPTQ